MEKSLHEQLERIYRIEKEAAEEDSSKEKNQVSIDPDSYIAKEIRYQTVLIQELREEIYELKKAKRNEEQRSPVRKGRLKRWFLSRQRKG